MLRFNFWWIRVKYCDIQYKIYSGNQFGFWISWLCVHFILRFLPLPFYILQSNGSQDLVPRSARSSSPRNLFRMQILGLHPGPTECESLGVGCINVVTSSSSRAASWLCNFCSDMGTLHLNEPCAWFNDFAITILEFLIIS